MKEKKTDWSKDQKPRLQLLSGDTLAFEKERFTTTAKLLTNIQPPRVRVVFNHRSMEKIRALCEACDIEIGALGLMDEKQGTAGDRIFKVYDIFVPEQECSAVVTKMTPDGIFKLFHELDAAYGIKKAVAIKDKLSYWWHSHVNMGTGPSGQDEREFTEQSNARRMFFMSIGNKQGDLHVNVKLKVPELADWAQWEIRDIVWEKDWETVVSIKDEVHPLLLEEGEKPYRVRTFTDSGAGEIVRDPKVYAWAQEQVQAKVKGLGSGYFSRYPASKRSTLIMPDELAKVKVEEYQITEEQDLEQFILELWGEKPPIPVAPPVLTPAPVPVESSSESEVQADVKADVKEDSVITKDPEMTSLVSESHIPTYQQSSDDKDGWWIDLCKMRKWWPSWLSFRFYDEMIDEMPWYLRVIVTIWMLVVVLFIRPLGWIVFTLTYKIVRLLLWDWYAVPIMWSIRNIRASRLARREARKEREVRIVTPQRRVGKRIRASRTEAEEG